ncbi:MULTISPECIES: hypothetical protein [Peptostreptococcaceae]|uniref:Uncharacterized protein n=1 Tax=Paeniclostridium hominis TaxID=2764329 RepID=A0ABR7K644_9FIRM|nr:MULTISPECIES: hypothetical protein [Peptostreptococcaceae]MBC6004569.1 hypothetical protein [Paeniclostridium hominis]MDB3376230.1 hypothetical protein [Clostridioides difficile]MDY6679390.1 hypothetical protein [Clostridioides difficile]CEQ16307.1 Uncharacterised protein [[Clostridium] sordellii] [Paeniclostridium sordellii]HEK8814285.1 hypothetical protein [Clostridioides difficile]
MYKDTITLAQLLREVYDDTDLGKSGVNMSKTTKDNMIEKLRAIGKSLGIDVEKYRIKNRYKIPRIIADILQIYLTVDSSKGSFISKINTKQYEKITKEEKIEFLNKVIITLEDKYKNDENYTNIQPDIEHIKNTVMLEIEFSHGEREVIEDIKREITDKIDLCFREYTDIKPDDGLIRVNDEIYTKSIKFQKITSDEKGRLDVLSEYDKMIFIRHLKERIDQSIEEWKELIRLANEIKNAEIDNIVEVDEDMNNEKFVVEGRELLRRSIDEYKIESMQKYKNKKIEHDEDMEQILKDIKKEIDSRYK